MAFPFRTAVFCAKDEFEELVWVASELSDILWGVLILFIFRGFLDEPTCGIEEERGRSSSESMIIRLFERVLMVYEYGVQRKRRRFGVSDRERRTKEEKRD